MEFPMQRWQQSLLALALATGMTSIFCAEAIAQGEPTTKRCSSQAGAKAEPATPPNRTAADGTAPGNAGSTGWTGGTGGAHAGTNPQGATEHSPTWQPPTARGLDLAVDAPQAASKDC
jgi:hypothetical protein